MSSEPLTFSDITNRFNSFENEIKRFPDETKLEVILYYNPSNPTDKKTNSVIYRYTAATNWQSNKLAHLSTFITKVVEGYIIYRASLTESGEVSIYKAGKHVLENVNSGFSNNAAEDYAKQLISVYYKALMLFGADTPSVMKVVCSGYLVEN
jgi:hypothetical protein